MQNNKEIGQPQRPPPQSHHTPHSPVYLNVLQMSSKETSENRVHPVKSFPYATKDRMVWKLYEVSVNKIPQ